MSKEQTKKKRRMKRRGILDILIRSCFMWFGLTAVVSGEQSVQNNNNKKKDGWPHDVP